MKSIAFALSLVLAGTAQPAFAANGIKDGSFEDPQLPGCCKQKFKTGDEIGAWTVTGGGKVVLTSTDREQGGFSFQAQKGRQWLQLTGGDKPGGVVQSVERPEETTYLFTFYIGAVYDPNGKNGTSSSVNVLINGHNAGTFTANAVDDGTNKMQWTQAQLHIGGSGTIQLSLVGADPQGDTACGIDNAVFKKEF